MGFILDQFETEPNAFYSGSFFDGLFRGDIRDTSGRIRVASKASGSNELLYATYYSEYAEVSGTNRNKNIGADLRFSSHVCKDELYQDVILPDIYECYLLNGGKATVAYTESGSASTFPILLTDSLPGIPAGFPVGKLIFTPHNTTASYQADPAINVGDKKWLASFPFQSTYKNITKNITPYVFKTNIRCPSKVTLTNCIPIFAQNLSNDETSLATVEIVVPRFAWLHGTVSGPGNNEPYRYVLIDVSGSTSAGEIFEGFSNPANNFPPTGTGHWGVLYGTVRPRERLLLKCIYGFGDNYCNTPIITGVTSSKFHNADGMINTYYSSEVDIRGWKYGVMNAFPQYSSCVFRSSKFGQFRDMLEPRKYTKFFDPSIFLGRSNVRLRIATAAISVTFVSGTESAATASNPDTLNANDSGIYDFEYKSGRPWFDV